MHEACSYWPHVQTQLVLTEAVDRYVLLLEWPADDVSTEVVGYDVNL